MGTGALVLVLAAAVPLARAQEPGPGTRPRVCLALSGGGARGLAHVGVLRGLEEAGVPVDCIAGTSMGAVVGALYASRPDASRLEEVARAVAWPEIFAGEVDRTLRPVSQRVGHVEPVARLGFDLWTLRLPEAAIHDYRVNRFLARHLLPAGYRAAGDFDRLPIPFRAVAADLETGERVVLGAGALDRAVRASMSIPLAFAPVAHEGRVLVDGGMADNLPAGVARDLGGEVVVAVDVSSPPRRPAFWDLSAVAGQVTDVLVRARNREYEAPADVTVRPDLGRHGFTDYARLDGLLAAGRLAAGQALDALPRRTAAEAAAGPPAWPASARPGPEGLPIARVEVAGQGHVDERLIREVFGLRPGGPFSLEEALRGMDKVYATDLFESCWLALEDASGGGLAVVLHVRESPRGALEVGVAYNEADEAKAFLRLRDRNVLGWGERADLTGFVSDAAEGVAASLSGDRLAGLPLGYAVRGRLFDDKPRFFVGGEAVNRALFGRREVFVGLRRAVGRPLLIEGGLDLGRVETRPRLGLDFPPGRDEVRLLSGEIAWDRLDAADNPSAGEAVTLSLQQTLGGLGDTRDYWRARALAQVAVPLGGRVSVSANALAGTAGSGLPVYERFRLGGPVLLPGYHREELWGPHVAAASLGLGVRVLGRARLTARAGVGGAWATRGEASLSSLRAGLGLEGFYPTPAGPAVLGLGLTGSGRAHVYVGLGFQ